VTTRRPVVEVTELLPARPDPAKRVSHPQLGVVAGDDPCLEGNHQVIAGQPERSFNHHLSVGTGAPICDRLLPEGWYRFSSPAGSLLPTECPGGNYCGTNIPVWMKGSVPTVSEGVVSSTACINQDRECCVGELDIGVRNCSSWVAYRLVPTPACNMGYCVGEGVPCPKGLASTNGYTPCDFTVKLENVLLTVETNDLKSEVVFHCLPVLQDVIEPSSIDIDVKWFADGENILSQTFNAGNQASSSLPEELWHLGQTIQCSAQAKHTIVGARTEKLESKPHFAGLQVSGTPVTLVEGGQVATLVLTATVPVLCSPQDRALGSCCVHLHLALGVAGQEQRCPWGGVLHRVGLPSCAHKICRHDWNSSHVIPLSAPEDWLYNGEQLVTLEIGTGAASTHLWRDYTLPLHTVQVVPGTRTEQCLSSSSISTFTDRQLAPADGGPGVYTLYQHIGAQQEVQLSLRRCNLRALCHCSVAVRIQDLVIGFDICSKGYLQVWSRGAGLSKGLPEGADLVSLDEGRGYRVTMPTGTAVTLGPYLSTVQVDASSQDEGSVDGLCGKLGRRPRALSSHKDIFDEWRLSPEISLFSSDLPLPRNSSSILPAPARGCPCTSNPAAQVLPGQCDQESRACQDPRASSVLEMVVGISKKENQPTLASLAEGGEGGQVATVKVVGGPVVPRPLDGWTIGAATEFCREFLQSSPAYAACAEVPGLAVEERMKACAEDVLYAGDSRAAQLHLDLHQETCRQRVSRNTSLWVMSPLHPDPLVLLPPQEILDTLCLNDCSGNGQCSKGVCLCAAGRTGADCGVSVSEGPRVASLENHGLCDVRDQPCRSFHVSGDNFADNSELVCHFEIFKIRGVASKQLVQDAIFSRPAQFISFQQVICEMPALDIHSNEERHRFDLRDNTDQTRMFIKVSVGYSEGGRSTPLDLLLYDSQCWTCNQQGECNAKPNNKCVFSAATSSVQTFRIGKSITNGEGSDFHICSLPHDSGSCDRKEFRYFYNSLERRCKLFVYGGCKGNQNNFLSEIDCVRRCGDKAAIDALALPELGPTPSLPEIDQCSLVKDEGICPGNVPRFYFDQLAERCLLFSYGGCGGNTNNFQSEESCISTCGGPTGALVHAIQLHGGLKPRKAICNHPINRGGCQAKLRRFYFDSRTETCKLFVFGGCQGNENNFATMHECVINCGGPALRAENRRITKEEPITTTPPSLLLATRPPAPVATKRILKLTTEAASRVSLPTLARNVSNRSSVTNSPAEIAFTSISLPSISPCGLPPAAGSCNSFRDRYHFDAALQVCKRFRFSGCGGNGNNFMTGENCVKNCGGIVEDQEPPLHTKHITERLVLPTMKTTTTPKPVSEDSSLRKRKMKRVKVERGRGKISESRSRAILNRARLRSRMSSSSSVVSSSTEQSIGQNEVSRTFRRPARMVGSTIGRNLSSVELETPVSRNELYPPRARHRDYLGDRARVDEVMKAPPNMKGGLVVIRSYCRYPPEELRRGGLCPRPSSHDFYFYNVSAATCEPLSGSLCTKSRNRFPSLRTCLKSCIVE